MYFGKADGLFGQYYAATGDKPVAAVVISHGVFQHSGVYDDFSRRLAAEGFAVFAYDHRGFGQSNSYDGCSRSQIAEWVNLDIPSAAGDMRDAVHKARELSGVKQVFVFGHSLGGLAAGLLGTSGDISAAGFILSNPTLQWHPQDLEAAGDWAKKAADDPDGVWANGALSAWSKCQAFIDFAGSEAISKHVEPGLPFKNLYWKGVVADAIPTVRQRLEKWTAPGLLLRSGGDVGTLGVPGSGCELGSCRDLVGGADPIAPLTLMFYPGGSHDVIFDSYPAMSEPGSNVVVDDIVAWLKRQTAS